MKDRSTEGNERRGLRKSEGMRERGREGDWKEGDRGESMAVS